MKPEKPLIIANWKMALDHQESLDLLQKIKLEGKITDSAHLIICPSYTALGGMQKVLERSSIEYGAQDCFWEDKGAYTGAVSPSDLSKLGCKYVIVGHSERRKYLGETNEMVHKKVRVVLEHNMTPILCIGEDWEERSENKRDYVLIAQLTEALDGILLGANHRLIVAYEPVWAISTGGGIEPEPSDVQYANEVIRQVLLDLFRKEVVASNITIIYGGSVKADNIKLYLEIPNVSGVLVGGASQKAESFLELVEAIS